MVMIKNTSLRKTRKPVNYGKHAAAAAAAAKSLQSCPTLCDSIEGSPPGSPVPGILQARTLEWVAISFSNGWKWKVKRKSLSRVWLLATPWTAANLPPPSVGFARQLSLHELIQLVSSSSMLPMYCGCCSVTQSCLTLCVPMDCSAPGFLVLHCLPEFVQTFVHWVNDAIQPSLLSSSPPALNLSQYQGLLQRVGFLHQVA